MQNMVGTKLQALVCFTSFLLEEGAEKRCSECGSIQVGTQWAVVRRWSSAGGAAGVASGRQMESSAGLSIWSGNQPAKNSGILIC